MTVAEFLESLIECNACSDGIEIAKGCGTLQEMADKADGGMLSWVLARWPELVDEVEVDWDLFNGDDWSMLLRAQPQFSEYYEWVCCTATPGRNSHATNERVCRRSDPSLRNTAGLNRRLI
jgi:hypothetical protein